MKIIERLEEIKGFLRKRKENMTDIEIRLEKIINLYFLIIISSIFGYHIWVFVLNQSSFRLDPLDALLIIILGCTIIIKLYVEEYIDSKIIERIKNKEV